MVLSFVIDRRRDLVNSYGTIGRNPEQSFCNIIFKTLAKNISCISRGCLIKTNSPDDDWLL